MHIVFIDIETTGLRPANDEITVVATAHMQGGCSAIQTQNILNLLRARDAGQGDAHLLDQICTWLDDADRIVAYNGKTFDLPFIAHKAGARAHLDEWQGKLVDFCAHVRQHTGALVSMSAMCTHNAIDVSKCATGKDAIVWADAREHAKLEEYCAQDVLVLVALTQHGVVHGLAVPLRRGSSARLTVSEALAVSFEGGGSRPHEGPVAALLG